MLILRSSSSSLGRSTVALIRISEVDTCTCYQKLTSGVLPIL